MTVLNLSDKDFEEIVLKKKNIVVCDFWAEWCGPCKQISPILEELSLEYKDTDITIGFVFHSRKYSDGSSNLRIQFSRGRGKQYAKNSGLRIFRKHWISKKNEVSDKHVDYIKINKNLNELKIKIENARNSFIDGTIDFEDAYKSIIN